ncbi:MAG: mechanosensitive ion channel, partial [bacterium]|nr:mechanosensitive ion channel [bacterium]
FILLFLSMVFSILKLEFICDLFYSEGFMFILLLGILFFILVLVVKCVVFLLFDILFARRQDIKYPPLIKDIVVILLYIIGILFITHYYLNIKVTVVLASSAVLTVVIGFALQDILGDLFSGIALNLEESLKIGDWIKTGDFEGRIEQFRWRSIKIRTIDNVLVVIPNQVAAKQAVQGYGHSRETFAFRTDIGVSYKHSPDFVIAVIMRVLVSIDNILKKPKPIVFVKNFDDFAVIYQLRYFTRNYAHKNAILGEINRKCWYAFKREHIEIPFPIRDVYIKKAAAEEWDHNRIRILMESSEILSTLDKEHLDALAGDIEIGLYGEGELVIGEGEEGRFFYHILEGEVEVLKKNRVVKRLTANDYFGELSLFTGEKTTADVRVSKESKILRLSSEKFRETVKINHKMAVKLSEVIAVRKAGLKEFARQESDTSRISIKKDSESILLRIKKYFAF